MNQLGKTHPTPVSFALAMATPMAKLPTTAPKLLFPSIRAVPEKDYYDHNDENNGVHFTNSFFDNCWTCVWITYTTSDVGNIVTS